MQNDIYRKGLVVGIILLFFGAGILPNISGNVLNKGQITHKNSNSGNILVYSTTSAGSQYDKTYFNINLTNILQNHGYSITVTDRKITPMITNALLADFEELWFFSTYPPSLAQLSQSEIQAIINFRTQKHGLLIMSDHTLYGGDYSDDANQISTQLGVTFFGVTYHGPDGSPISPNFVSHPLSSGVTTIVGSVSDGNMAVSSPAQVVATYQGDNLIAVLDDGYGRVVFDTSFTRLWNAGIYGYNWILVGDTPQYVRNIADWLNPGQPPVFGTPSPTNNSTNNPLSLNWSIPINDPEENTFTWTIQCSNGQTNGATGASNGTKTLTLSGLTYSTTYKVWVNATDPGGSNHYTRSWYTFTTKNNQPPIFGTPTPINGSIAQPVSLTWSTPINDPEGDTFSWTLQCSNGQTNSGAGASNGTKSLVLSGLTHSITYKVWVNATDPDGSSLYTRSWYTFTTKANQPPSAPTITGPSKGKINIETDYNFAATDPDNDSVYYFIDWGDNTNSSWIGPSSSGDKTIQSHTWSKKGDYTIKAKAKDSNGAESGWGELSVTMPYSYNLPFMQIWDRFFQRFPHAFPILRYLLRY